MVISLPCTRHKTRSQRDADGTELDAAGAAAVMGLVGVPAETKAATPDGPWDHETDVVCGGSGAAGSTAAVIARDRGVEVMLFEKMPMLGGTTYRSGRGAWVPNHLFLRAKGIEDKKDDCLL